MNRVQLQVIASAPYHPIKLTHREGVTVDSEIVVHRQVEDQRVSWWVRYGWVEGVAYGGGHQAKSKRDALDVFERWKARQAVGKGG